MKNKIQFVLCVLFGLMFLNSGLNKFLNYMPVPEDLPDRLMKMSTNMAEIGWLIPLIGVVEICGGILFIVPRTRALGAIVIFPVMIGILFTHITAAPSGLPLVITLMLILLWVMVDNRRRYLPMIQP